MTTQSPMPSQIYLNVFGYREEGIWYAHALEMDIVGSGSTFEEASAELRGLIDSQFSFAVFKKDPSLLWRPAPKEIIEKFYNLFIKNQPSGDSGVASKLEIEPNRSGASETYCLDA